MAMMHPKGGNGLYRPLAEINVTPLVDVMLVLLIIFMVTAPMLASGMKVNLPQAKQVQPLDPKAPIIITVGKDSSLSLGSDPVEREKLIDAVHEKLGSDISQMIHLRGDKEAPYGDVVAIMDLLATNGLTHIAIVADPHSKADTTTKVAASVKPDVAATLNTQDKGDATPPMPTAAAIVPGIPAGAAASVRSSGPVSPEASTVSTVSTVPMAVNPAVPAISAAPVAPAPAETPRP
jgi:biopolymer transport protein TolR